MTISLSLDTLTFHFTNTSLLSEQGALDLAKGTRQLSTYLSICQCRLYSKSTPMYDYDEFISLLGPLGETLQFKLPGSRVQKLDIYQMIQ